jgi:hypothetical protein
MALLLLLAAGCELLSSLGKVQQPGTESQTSGTSTSTAAGRPSAVTALAVSDGGALTATLRWDSPPAGVDRLLVIRLPAGDFWKPTDGVSYAEGVTVGNGKVVWNGLGSGFSESGLGVGQACRFVVFAVNSKLEYSEPAETAFVVPEPPPKFAGFDFALSEGDFWEYKYYYSV